jgi:hypothetical protein
MVGRAAAGTAGLVGPVGGDHQRRRVEVVVGDRLFNGRVLLERAAAEIQAESSVDPAELGVAIAAAADVLHALRQASGRLDVRAAEVPDLAAMHAWSLRLVKYLFPDALPMLCSSSTMGPLDSVQPELWQEPASLA